MKNIKHIGAGTKYIFQLNYKFTNTVCFYHADYELHNLGPASNLTVAIFKIKMKTVISH